jgi:hypothetical protein
VILVAASYNVFIVFSKPANSNRGQKALLPEVMLSNNREYSDERNMDDLDLPLFDFHVISDATNSFSLANKLGEGGFGTVYRVNKFPLFIYFSTRH